MSTHLKAVLGLSNKTPETKVTRSQTILDAMQNSGNFADEDLPVSYSNSQSAIDNFGSAIVAANGINASSADTSRMHEEERQLLGIFNLLRSHVEYVANQTADPATIITSAGMTVGTPGGQNAVTELTLDAPGNGKINVRVPRREGEKSFVFEVSTDGESFTKVTSNANAKVVLSGYTHGSTIYVRYYAISKDGESEMSQPKSVLVN
ncbi:MAG: hypothetical protein K0S33_3944 [Bacteroidetes bacterium]|jgi:hypothetical protein|nr:hypothetical protein [Bacteroidota bacterium]